MADGFSDTTLTFDVKAGIWRKHSRAQGGYWEHDLLQLWKGTPAAPSYRDVPGCVAHGSYYLQSNYY